MSLSSRIAALAALALSVAPLAGCDGVDADPLVTGPVVQFATTSTLAVEGSTVTIPVQITGTNGTPVTVEVLFAVGTSTTTLNTDFTGFGAATDGVQKATVTFAGTADETQNVTFQAVADGVAESAETAVFALQRVTGATIGARRQFTANIGVPTIAVVRAGTLLSTVTVEGVVTRAKGNQVWIQDATGGFVLFGATVATAITSGAILPGDRVQATGRLNEFQSGPTGAPVPGAGLLQVDNIAATGGFVVQARGQALPAPQVITLAQFTAGDPDTEVYESEIIRVTGITVAAAGDVVFVAAKNYTVSQTVGGVTSTAVLRIGGVGATDLIGTVIPTGVVTFQGPAGQFRGTNQLTPVLLADLAP